MGRMRQGWEWSWCGREDCPSELFSKDSEKKGSKLASYHSVSSQRSSNWPTRCLTTALISLLGPLVNFIDECMADNPGTQLADRLREMYPGVKVSISTVKRARKELGWISKKTQYCALISDINKSKRVEWCKCECWRRKRNFKDVIWTDEWTIQLEPHRKRYFRKEGQLTRLTGRPKHPPKVNIWRGISNREQLRL